MAISYVLLSILVITPLCLVLFTSVHPEEQFEWLLPFQVIINAGLNQVILNTILLGLLVVVNATLLALPIAYLSAKTKIGRHRWLDVVLIIPFMTPPYIGSMGWILFMQKKGFLEQMVPWSEYFTQSFFSLFGMVSIMSLHLFPFLYLILRNALVKIGGTYEEAGAVFGGGFSYRLRKIVTPLLLSSYVMGALLVFIKTIAEFGTPATFGRQIGFYVLTSEIHKYVSNWPIDFGKATSLASVLLATCMLFWYMQSIISRRCQYATVGGKGGRQSRIALTGWKSVAVWSYIIVLLLTSIGVPYFSIIIGSLQKLRGNGLQWGNFTLAHYNELFSFGSPGLKALTNSLGLALLAATVAALLGLFLALQIGRAEKSSQRLIDLLGLLPNTIPGIVLIVGLVLLWNAPWMPISIYNTYGFVVLAYVVLFLPYSIQYTKSTLGQIDMSLISAGSVFGGTGLYNFRRIILPLLIPGILAGWTMTFTISIRELVASLMILPPSMEVSATYIFAQFEQGSVSLGMAMAVVSVGLTTSILVIMNYIGVERKRG